MPKNNLKICSVEELNQLNSLLNSEIVDNKLVIYGNQRPNRKTVHILDKAFRINVKQVGYSITITPECMNLFKEINNDKVSIFDVQNAINFLSLSYTPISKENILNIISKKYKKEI